MVPAKPVKFRIPGWCQKATLRVNGEAIDSAVKSGSYQRLTRQWKKGDRVTIDLPMPVVAMVADPRARELRDRVALMRGPLVYSFEGVDNPGLDVRDIRLSTGQKRPAPEGSRAPGSLYEVVAELPRFDAVSTPDLLGGITVLRGTGSSGDVPSAKLTAIPYYAWANRGPSTMRIWVGRSPGL